MAAPNIAGLRTNSWPTTAIVSTTNATPTVLFGVNIPPTTTVVISCQIAARRTGGSSGTTEDGAGWEVFAAYKNVAGTATLIGSQGITFAAKDQAGWAVAFGASGANATMTITGAANNNIDWLSTYQSGTRVS